MRLAIVGLAMGWSCELGYVTVESLLNILGFEHVWSGNYMTAALQRSAISEPAYTFAHKAIEKDGQVRHIVCAVFKGTTTVADTITDLESVNDGFLAAGKRCANALSAYVQGIEGATNANTTLFITGHSLGGAIANVVGRLTKDIAEDDQRFVYTYASPNYECGDDGKSGYVFPNFRTFTNVADIVPEMPEGLTKIGIEYTYDREALDARQRARFDESYQYFRGPVWDLVSPEEPGALLRPRTLLPGALSRGAGRTFAPANVPTGYTNGRFVRPAGEVADLKVRPAEGALPRNAPSSESRSPKSVPGAEKCTRGSADGKVHPKVYPTGSPRRRTGGAGIQSCLQNALPFFHECAIVFLRTHARVAELADAEVSKTFVERRVSSSLTSGTSGFVGLGNPKYTARYPRHYPRDTFPHFLSWFLTLFFGLFMCRSFSYSRFV